MSAPHNRDDTSDTIVTRDRIMKVSLALIADHGFAATSTREISGRLGVTKAALYYHFRTKEDLLLALVAPVVADLQALLDQPRRPGRAGRRQVVGDYVTLVAAHREIIQVLAEDPSARQCQGLKTAVMPVLERLVQVLSGEEVASTARRVLARAAVGAINMAVVLAEPSDDSALVMQIARDAALAVLGLQRNGRGPILSAPERPTEMPVTELRQPG